MSITFGILYFISALPIMQVLRRILKDIEKTIACFPRSGKIVKLCEYSTQLAS